MSIQPPVVRAAWVQRPQSEAFEVFTEEIGAWWPLPSHGLFGLESATVAFRDGKLVEQATDGRQIVWGQVQSWEPPERLVLSWHPGGDESQASQVEVSFEADGDGTRVLIEHRGWEVFGDDAVNRRLGYVGPSAWGHVLDHFADVAEIRPDAVDTTALVAAYAAFYAEAELGGFGSATQGEWDAEQTVAHVVLNDAAMLAVTQALVHQNPARFENEVCQDPVVLADFIEACGGMPGLIERGRASAMLVVASVSRLSSEQLDAAVHCCLSHDGQNMLDREMPWQAVAVATQAGMHLPAHIDQLRNLRT